MQTDLPKQRRVTDDPLELFSVPDGESLHGEDLVHEFPGAEAVLVDHVPRLVLAHRAVLVAGPVPPRLQRLHT